MIAMVDRIYSHFIITTFLVNGGNTMFLPEYLGHFLIVHSTFSLYVQHPSHRPGIV